MTVDQYLLEIPEITYDRKILLDIFEEAKSFARLKGLSWKEKPKHLVKVNDASSVVIQFEDYMMLDDSKKNLSYNFLEHEYIKNLIKQLNFSHPVTAGNIDIIWYRKSFVFEPHTDHYAATTMMFPIFPIDGGAPVDFYYNENVELTPGKAQSFENIVNQSDIIYTHYYDTTFPTLFNSHWIHGVRKVDNERAYLRLRINESFNEVVKKYKSGTLVRVL